MTTSELRDILCIVRNTQDAVDYNGNLMLDLLAGRLRQLSPYKLARIKRELKNFNAHTKTWKN